MRVIVILVVGTVSLTATMLGSRYLVAQNRPQTREEWRAAERAKFQAEWQAKARQDMKQAIANATNEKERKLYEYELRIFEHKVKSKEIASLVDVSDGVDDFEALIIAQEYFGWQFGLCGLVDLPERRGESWVVPTFVGSAGKEDAPIIIDARSGAIRCAGHPTISDALAFVKGPKPPSPSPESTTPNGTH